MRLEMKRAGVATAALALVAAAACSNSSKPIDSSLKADLDAVSGSNLELAPTTAKSQVVVSSIEETPEAAPARASHAPVTKPAPQAPKRVASHTVRRPAPAPAPKQTVADVAPQEPQPEPQPVQQAPAPAPATVDEPAPAPMQRPAQQRQSGTYKTEGEIFKQMPWIRP